jgi:hypothetical protein
MTDSDMPKLLLLILVVIALVVLGWAWAWPFSNIVLKPWFPTYLRLMGVYALLIAVLVAYGAYQVIVDKS